MQTDTAQERASSMRMSGVCRCRMRVKATSFSPPAIFCTSLYVPNLPQRRGLSG